MKSKTIRCQLANGSACTIEGSPEAVMHGLNAALHQTDALSICEEGDAPAGAAKITIYRPVTNAEEVLALPTTLGTGNQAVTNAGDEQPLALPAMAFKR